MKKSMLNIAVAGALLVSGAAFAAPGDMYIDLGTNEYDFTFLAHTADADTTTGTFEQFTFGQFLATSFYNVSEGALPGSLAGDFFDTNDSAVINSYDVGAGTDNLVGTHTAADGSSSVTILDPAADPVYTNIADISPLSGTFSNDTEGYGTTWTIDTKYEFFGTLGPGGPTYTGGTINFIFNDVGSIAAASGLQDGDLLLTASLTGSVLSGANLDLLFDITFSKDGWLFVEDANGNIVDANDLTGPPSSITMAIDTNVVPPIPTLDQLVLATGPLNGSGAETDYAVRQAELDGSIEVRVVPVPGTLAILGLGLAAFAGSVRRKRA